MKKTTFTTFVITAALVFVPLFVSAHAGDTDGMPMMSDTAQNVQVTNEEFDQIQDVMIKMMNGEQLTDSEWQEMNEFMESHEGNMMGPGFYGQNGNMMWGGNGAYGNHMIWGNGLSSFNYWIMTLMMLVWLLVGILVVVYLIKKLNK